MFAISPGTEYEATNENFEAVVALCKQDGVNRGTLLRTARVILTIQIPTEDLVRAIEAYGWKCTEFQGGEDELG